MQNCMLLVNMLFFIIHNSTAIRCNVLIKIRHSAIAQTKPLHNRLTDTFCCNIHYGHKYMGVSDVDTDTPSVIHRRSTSRAGADCHLFRNRWTPQHGHTTWHYSEPCQLIFNPSHFFPLAIMMCARHFIRPGEFVEESARKAVINHVPRSRWKSLGAWSKREKGCYKSLKNKQQKGSDKILNETGW